MFNSIINIADGNVSMESALICILCSMICGAIIAFIYMYKANYTKSFVVSLIIMPALVQVVMMLVNGNLGAGVAILGAFSLIRYRSIPGTSKDLTAIFFAMAVGLANGMGYVTYSFCITAVIGFVFLILYMLPFAEKRNDEKQLKVLIPENLNYATVFDDIFEKFTHKSELVKVRTTNLGTMFELTYIIKLKDDKEEKTFIDELRCRNGNLTITCQQSQNRGSEEL